MMHAIPKWMLIAPALVLAIFVAGFFHEDERGAAPCAPKAPVTTGVALEQSRAMAEPASAARGDFAVPQHLYHRKGEFNCKVDSVIDIYTAIDADIERHFGGEIQSMEITGNDDGRQGVLHCAVSTDKFNDFITYIRKKGKVLSERISASAKPKGVPRHGAEDGVDERELSLVTVRVMDEKVAKEVGESKGLLAASFSKSTSHFLAGIALIVEGMGWVAPYIAVLALLVLPFVVVAKLKRRASLSPAACEG